MQREMKRKNVEDVIDHVSSRSYIRAAASFLPAVLKRHSPSWRWKDNGATVDLPLVNGNEEGEAEPGTKVPIRRLTFVLVAVVPFFLSVYYYAFVASDQFTAEARFAVRSLADSGGNDGVEGGVLDMRAATQDAYVVTSFIQSTELLRRIGARMDYRAMFDPPGTDYFSGFPLDGSAEDFLEYWRRQVTAYIDGPSGIITLKVRTFRPQDSVRIATAIIQESELLINQMSQRARNDVVKGVKAEVEEAGKAYGEALASLNSLQHETQLLSPEARAMETGKLLTGLLAQKLELETRQYVVRQSSAEGSPAYQQLALARESLDSQIDTLRAELTGAESASIAKALQRFSELETNRLVAEKLYEVARKTYNSALVESVRKALYVVVFVQPSLPEESLYPRRVFTPVMTLLVLGVIWAILALAWASIQDHRI